MTSRLRTGKSISFFTVYLVYDFNSLLLPVCQNVFSLPLFYAWPVYIHSPVVHILTHTQLPYQPHPRFPSADSYARAAKLRLYKGCFLGKADIKARKYISTVNTTITHLFLL